MLLAVRRGSLRAEDVTGHQYETISHWLQSAADHSKAPARVLVDHPQFPTAEIGDLCSIVGSRRAASP